MAYRFLPAALRRVREIWDYTDAQWGTDQADAYVRGLYDAVEYVSENREGWQPVTDSELDDIYVFKYTRHFVFFRELRDGSLGVASILHERMNVPERLWDDLDR